ncbi:hypothetical protein D516_3115 [Rhodobacter sp. AKP1]|nr:Hypothetical Protein RSKD131_1634 [Cereibacter sphaeroides KD131]EKX56342.1 hypothetical protein D516_3115 [Rhodobacter sp. AKP1]
MRRARPMRRIDTRAGAARYTRVPGAQRPILAAAGRNPDIF